MNRTRSALVLTVASLAAITGSGVAEADPPEEVDQSLLVPTTLDSSFAPFDCKLKSTGPVCSGERHISGAWAPSDLPCDVPVHGRLESDRVSTRYYGHDYLNYDRRVRIDDTDYLSTSPAGPAMGTISTHGSFREPFAVPGDESTRTIVTHGTIWDIRPVGGPAIFRAVGTLVEPPDGTSSFTGHVTVDGVTTTYDGVPYKSFLSDDQFVSYVCRAATGG
jgi:hypothetical protein